MAMKNQILKTIPMALRIPRLDNDASKIDKGHMRISSTSTAPATEAIKIHIFQTIENDIIFFFLFSEPN